MDPITRSKTRPRTEIEIGSWDFSNPTVRNRFNSVVQTNNDISDGLSQPDCKCFYQARFDVMIGVTGGSTPEVTWCVTSSEQAWCYGGGTWDTGGWEFTNGSREILGNAAYTRFGMKLSKPCNDCDCGDNSINLKTYSNGMTEGQDGYGWSPYKNAPQWVKDLHAASADDSFSDSEKKSLEKSIRDFMSNSAQDPWKKDPADKKCAEIDTYCAGATIP